MRLSDNIDDELPIALKNLREQGDGMNLPDAYFEQMERSVFARLDASGSTGHPGLVKSKTPKWRTIFVRPKATLAYAAALALMLSALWFMQQHVSPSSNNLSLAASLTAEDIEDYLLDNLHEFDLVHIATLSHAIEVEGQAPTPQESKPPGTGPSNELRPEDLDKILDDMTEEELEQIL